MYDNRSNLIIGFHGCDKPAAHALLTRPDVIKMSEEKYDWIGYGMYFWENSQERAWQWARDRQIRKRKDENDAAVVGAIIQLGYCCDFMDARFTSLLKTYYNNIMNDIYNKNGTPLPENKNAVSDPHQDKIIRVLDCTVIEFMHARIIERYKKDRREKGFSEVKVFDSMRSVFMEGSQVYNGAGIFEKSHIQICIRNPNCIKGFFLPRQEINFL